MDNCFYIVCPVYNGEKTIERAVDSVKNQTYTNWILIIVDDGSSDNTLHICKDYANYDKRIIVLSKKNGGPYEAREYAIEFLKNRVKKGYFLFLDSDDSFNSDALELIHLKINSFNSPDIVLFNSSWYNLENKPRKKYYEIYNQMFVSSPKELIIEATINNNYSYIWATAIKCELVFSCEKTPYQYHKLKMAEDYVKLVSIYLQAKNSLLITETIYNHFENPSSITVNNDYSGWIDWLKGIDYVNEKIIRSYPELLNTSFLKKKLFFGERVVFLLETIVKNKLSFSVFTETCDITYRLKSFKLLYSEIIKTNNYYKGVFSNINHNEYKKAFGIIRRHLNKIKIRQFYVWLENLKRSVQRYFFLSTHFNFSLKNISIFGNNCISGSIYKNCNYKLLSPMVWCTLNPLDMAKFANKLHYYLNCEISEDINVGESEKKKNHPYAFVGDIKIIFPHCVDYADIKSKWDRRVKRVNYSNIYIIIFVEKGLYSQELVEEYNKISYKSVMIGYDANIFKAKNYYRLECKNDLAWYNTIGGIKQYWELYDWKSFFR